jgi:cytochrome P450
VSKKMEARLASKVPQEAKDLLQKYLDTSEKSDIIQKDTIVRLVNSTISAAVDTTAMTMTGILYFLMKNPRTLVHLRKEIEDAVATGQLSFPCRFQDVNRLPYLDAVIKETQRINPMISIPLERVVPAKGAVIAANSSQQAPWSAALAQCCIGIVAFMAKMSMILGQKGG